MGQPEETIVVAVSAYDLDANDHLLPLGPCEDDDPLFAGCLSDGDPGTSNDGGTVAEWDDYAADWDDSAAVQAYANGAFESLAGLAEAIGFNLTDATACDYGCGTGLLTERLASRCAHIDGIDTSSAMLQELRTKIDRRRWNHIRLLEQLPATPQRYDLIVCSSVLSFVKDYPATVKTLATHLAAGGLFVQWDWELNPDDDEPSGLTGTDIHQTLEDAGLEAVAVGIGFEATIDGHKMSPLMGSGSRAS